MEPSVRTAPSNASQSDTKTITVNDAVESIISMAKHISSGCSGTLKQFTEASDLWDEKVKDLNKEYEKNLEEQKKKLGNPLPLQELDKLVADFDQKRDDVFFDSMSSAMTELAANGIGVPISMSPAQMADNHKRWKVIDYNGQREGLWAAVGDPGNELCDELEKVTDVDPDAVLLGAMMFAAELSVTK